jgi:RNA polymerase sigma-70 factor (ECF subfamily)
MTEDPFVAHRGLLFTVAYEMLGSAADAEDVLQESWLRWDGVDQAGVRDPRSYLVRVVTRQALNRLRTLSRSREDYIGEWLPEPLLTSPDVAEDVELAESVSIAMLTVLETLAPAERAVFVLREVFEIPYSDIAAALGKNTATVRQIARRAREHVAARRPRMRVTRSEQQAVVERFLTALRTGQLTELMEVMAPDVVLIADGGGLVQAARKPLHGNELVATMLTRLRRSVYETTTILLNGAPAARLDNDGRRVAVSLEVADGLITRIYVIANPRKLTRLDEPADLARLSQQRRADQGPDVLALADTPHGAVERDVEDVHRQFLLAGQHERALVHDLHPGGHRLLVGERGVPPGTGLAVRVTVIDPVRSPLGHQQRVGVELESALDRRIVGCHVGLPDPAGQHHDQAAAQVAVGPEPDERLSHALHRDGGHDTDVAGAPAGQRPPEHQRVHHGAQHADVVGLSPADPPVIGHPAAEEVAAPDNHPELDSEPVHREQLLGQPRQARRIHPGPGLTRQRLAAEFHHDSPVPCHRAPSGPGAAPVATRHSLPLPQRRQQNPLVCADEFLIGTGPPDRFAGPGPLSSRIARVGPPASGLCGDIVTPLGVTLSHHCPWGPAPVR